MGDGVKLTLTSICVIRWGQCIWLPLFQSHPAMLLGPLTPPLVLHQYIRNAFFYLPYSGSVMGLKPIKILHWLVLLCTVVLRLVYCLYVKLLILWPRNTVFIFHSTFTSDVQRLSEGLFSVGIVTVWNQSTHFIIWLCCVKWYCG